MYEYYGYEQMGSRAALEKSMAAWCSISDPHL